MENRATVHPNGVWEVIGILAAIIPCGILAGLYLATADPRFLVATFGFAVLAIGIVFGRNPRRLNPLRRRRGAGASSASAGRTDVCADASAGMRKFGAAATALTAIFTKRILKLLALVGWLLAWGVTASLYVKVFENVNLTMLVMLVVVGGVGPILMYVGLETGVKKLSGRLNDSD